MTTEQSAQIQSLLSAARTSYPESEELLVQLLQRKTINDRTQENPPQEYADAIVGCFDYLEKWAAKNGFTWRNYDNLVAVAELPPTEPESDATKTIGAPLHIDVVPVDEVAWDHPPFSGAVIDGEIWGRGAQDDKGPSAAMLEAARFVKEAGLPRKNRLKLIIGSTEETGDWECMARYLEEEPAPDFSIVPDAEFPIINGEKGIITFVFTSPPISDAPVWQGVSIAAIQSGRAVNIVPDAATVTMSGSDEAIDRLKNLSQQIIDPQEGLRWEITPDPNAENSYNLTVKGKACHASLPADGYNAAVGLLELLVALADGADDKLACFVRFLAKAAVGHHGDGLNINVMHPYIGRTTAQLAILNWKACGSIVGKINVRNATGLSCAEALENVKAVVGADADAQGADITLTTSDTPRDPIFVDPENHPDEIEALKRSYQDVQDRDATLLAIGGTTFAKAMPNAVCFGGIDHADGEPSLIHQNNERVKVAHYQRNINIYTLALARLLSGNSDL